VRPAVKAFLQAVDRCRCRPGASYQGCPACVSLLPCAAFSSAFPVTLHAQSQHEHDPTPRVTLLALSALHRIPSATLCCCV
jgi:hypothetical protein